VLEEYNLIRLETGYTLKKFDCGDKDLNEFYKKDSFDYLKQLLAVTYIFEAKNKAVAFYSVSNDRIAIRDDMPKSEWKRKVQKFLPHPKRRKDYPAVKIGRLGVCEEEQSSKLGSEILKFIKYSFTANNKTGCKFIVVDAYNKERVINFYKKNDFAILCDNIKEDEQTVLMYYDLARFIRP